MPDIIIITATVKSNNGVNNKAFDNPMREIALLLNKTLIQMAKRRPAAKNIPMKVAISVSWWNLTFMFERKVKSINEKTV